MPVDFATGDEEANELTMMLNNLHNRTQIDMRIQTS